MTPIEQLEKHQKYIYNICLKRVMDRGKAEELLQEVNLRALRYIGSYREEGKFMSWVGLIINSAHINWIRKDKYRNEKLKSMPFSDKVRNEGEYFGEIERVWNAFDCLTSIEQEVMELIVDGYSYEDVAKQVNKPLGTVKSIINRSRKKLASKLGIELVGYGKWNEVV